jgi:uncharacterized protein (TIGR02996 family)
MSGHRDFLRDIASQPHDPAPRIAYAQWLERRGDDRAEFLRLHVSLADCDDDEEFGRLLRREHAIRWRADDDWLAAMGDGELYARLFHLHEGLWLTRSGTVLRWGTPLEELAACDGGRLEQIQPLGVRIVWKDRVIWRGLRATVHADFLPNDDGDLPTGVDHFTILKPSNWFVAEPWRPLQAILIRLLIKASPTRLRAAENAHGEAWLEKTRLRFGSPTDECTYRGLFRSIVWQWSCANLEWLMREDGSFLCGWLEHPTARRRTELRRIEEAARTV